MRENTPAEENPSARQDELHEWEEVIDGLENLVNALEQIDWSDVPAISPLEIGALSQRIGQSIRCMKMRLHDARERELQ